MLRSSIFLFSFILSFSFTPFSLAAYRTTWVFTLPSSHPYPYVPPTERLVTYTIRDDILKVPVPGVCSQIDLYSNDLAFAFSISCPASDSTGKVYCNISNTQSGQYYLQSCPTESCTSTGPCPILDGSFNNGFNINYPEPIYGYFEVINHGSVAGTLKAVPAKIKFHFRDTFLNAVTNFTPKITVIPPKGSVTTPVLNCTASNNQGVSTCTMIANDAGAYQLIVDGDSFAKSVYFFDSAPKTPRHIFWGSLDSRLIKDLRALPAGTDLGNLRTVALTAEAIMGDNRTPDCISESVYRDLPLFKNELCFRLDLLMQLRKLDIHLYYIDSEPQSEACVDDPNTAVNEKARYSCRDPDETLKFFKAIAALILPNGKPVFDGIILDEPGFREDNRKDSTAKESIYRMRHPSRLIYKMRNQLSDIRPGFKIIEAEPDGFRYDRILTPPDGKSPVIFDMYTGYWYISPNPNYIKSLAKTYNSKSGMWVNGYNWSNNAQNTLNQYKMDSVIFLFGNAPGNSMSLSDIQSKIIPLLGKPFAD